MLEELRQKADSSPGSAPLGVAKVLQQLVNQMQLGYRFPARSICRALPASIFRPL
jgi:hypothetical protein